MKTVQELVYNLNTNYSLDCDYEETDESIIISEGSSPLISFTKDCWEILNGFCMLHHEMQKYIMDFAYSTTSKDWFPEKKYNIIVGPSYKDGDVAAYHKTEKEECFSVLRKVMCLDSFVSKNDLHREDYQFTESEIEQLKSTLSENKAKIVDLGKVEVDE